MSPFDVVGAVAMIGLFVFLSILAVQAFKTWQARIRGRHSEEYERLAADYGRLLDDITTIQRQHGEELTELRRSVAAIEKLLRDVG